MPAKKSAFSKTATAKESTRRPPKNGKRTVAPEVEEALEKVAAKKAAAPKKKAAAPKKKSAAPKKKAAAPKKKAAAKEPREAGRVKRRPVTMADSVVLTDVPPKREGTPNFVVHSTVPPKGISVEKLVEKLMGKHKNLETEKDCLKFIRDAVHARGNLTFK